MVNSGVIKDWKRHKEMVLSLSVPKGEIKLVLVDHRVGSNTDGETQEIILGNEPKHYNLVTIPVKVWAGFKCINYEPAIMANCASIVCHPDEAENIPLDDPAISYQW